MYDTLGDPITISLGLLYTLLTLRLVLDFNVHLYVIAIDFIRRGFRKR